MRKPINLMIMWANFGPYHLVRLCGVRKMGERRGVEVLGLELAGSQRAYAWEAQKSRREIITLFPESRVEDISAWCYFRRTWAVLQQTQPDVLAIPGYDGAANLTALVWAKIKGKIAILMSASKSNDQPRQIWKEWVKRLIVRGFDAALVGGRPQKEYAVSLGIPADQVFVGYDVVDNEHYARGAAAARAKEGEVRRSLGLPRPFFLIVCRFIKEKNLFHLLEAYRLYRQRHPHNPWDLVLCGSGSMEAKLKETATDLPGVDFPGYKQADDLPAYYALAQALILPSISEPWGLVVNEAMASGLPVLVSKACGCSPDLVKEGVNGFTFDPYDVAGMARLLGKMSSGEVDLKAMGEVSRRIIADWTPEVFAENLFKAVEAAQAAKKARKWWGRKS